MIRHITAAITTTAVLTGLALAPAQAADRELVYGSWISPKHPVNRIALPPFFKNIAKDSGGKVKWKLVAGGQLVNGRGTLAGIRDSLIDAGFGIAPYTAKHLPSTNLIFSTLIFGEDIVAATGAAMETVLLNCPSCITENKKNNGIALGGYMASPYMMMCRQNIKSLADVKGKKIRGSGGGVSLIKLAGATPVPMSPAAATTALQRGAIDCVLGSPGWLRSYGYQDVVKSIVDYPLGMGGPAMALYLNRKVWNKLSMEQKKIHVKYAPRVVADIAITGYLVEDVKVVKAAVAKGVKINKGGADFAGLADMQLKAQRARNIANAKKFGVKNPEAILDAYAKSVKKWQGLSKGIGTDPAKFADVLTREVYSKMDLSKL